MNSKSLGMGYAREKREKAVKIFFFNLSNAKTYFLILRKGMPTFGSYPETFLDNYNEQDVALYVASCLKTPFPFDWPQFSF